MTKVSFLMVLFLISQLAFSGADDPFLKDQVEEISRNLRVSHLPLGPSCSAEDRHIIGGTSSSAFPCSMGVSRECIRSWLRSSQHICQDWVVEQVQNPSGSTVGGIYLVRKSADSKPVFIVKHVDDGAICRDEIRGLKEIRKKGFLRKKSSREGSLSFSQAEAVVKFHTKDDRKECLILLHAAQGKTFDALEQEFEEDPESLSLMATEFGRGLGLWHASTLRKSKNQELNVEHLQTLVHGDVNHGNIFCNPTLGSNKKLKACKLTMIDNGALDYGSPLKESRHFLKPWIGKKYELESEKERIIDLLEDESVPEDYQKSEKLRLSGIDAKLSLYKQIISKFIDSYSKQFPAAIGVQISNKLKTEAN